MKLFRVQIGEVDPYGSGHQEYMVVAANLARVIGAYPDATSITFLHDVVLFT